MKITIEHGGAEYVVKSESDDMLIDQVVDYVFGLLYTAGWHPDCIANAFINKGNSVVGDTDSTAIVEEDPPTRGGSPRPIHEYMVTVKSRYGEIRNFYEIGGVWYFDVCNDEFVSMSCVEDGSLGHVDPSGGPWVGINTYLSDISKDLPEVVVQKIERDAELDMFKLTTKTTRKK